MSRNLVFSDAATVGLCFRTLACACLLTSFAGTGSAQELTQADANESALPSPIRIELATDVWPGKRGSNPQTAVVHDDVMYFAAEHPRLGRRIWRYDGVTAEPQLWAEGPMISRPGAELGLCGNRIISSWTAKNAPFANIGPTYDELWEYDGRRAHRIENAYVLSGSWNYFTEYRGALYFTGVDDEHGTEPWVCEDGRARLLSDIAPGAESSYCRYFFVFQDKLYFFAVRGEADLYCYDGDKVTPCADINPGPLPSTMTDSRNQYPRILDGMAYFGAQHGNHGHDLWSWDGEVARLAVDLQPFDEHAQVQMGCVYKGALYFSLSGATRNELWRFDGERAERLPFGNNVYVRANATGVVGDYLLLIVDDGEHGPEPWYYDGEAPPRMIADVMPGPEGSDSMYSASINGRAFGIARLPYCGNELCEFVISSDALSQSRR